MEPGSHTFEIPPSFCNLKANTMGDAAQKDLHPKSVELSDKREDYENILGLARDHAIDSFSLFKWLFHELKEVKLNQRALGSKLEAMPIPTCQDK